ERVTRRTPIMARNNRRRARKTHTDGACYRRLGHMGHALRWPADHRPKAQCQHGQVLAELPRYRRSARLDPPSKIRKYLGSRAVPIPPFQSSAETPASATTAGVF